MDTSASRAGSGSSTCRTCPTERPDPANAITTAVSRAHSPHGCTTGPGRRPAPAVLGADAGRVLSEARNGLTMDVGRWDHRVVFAVRRTVLSGTPGSGWSRYSLGQLAGKSTA